MHLPDCRTSHIEHLVIEDLRIMAGGAPKTTRLDDVHGSGNAFLNSANSFTGNINHGNTTLHQPLCLFFNSGWDTQDPRRSTLLRDLGGTQSRDIHCSSTLADPGCANKPTPTFPNVVKQHEDPEWGRRKHLEIMTAKGNEIVDIYDSLLDNCDEVATRVKERHKSLGSISTIRNDISEQQIRFKVTNDLLLRAVSRPSTEMTERSFFLFMGVKQTLDTIHLLLTEAPMHFKRILREVEVGTNFRSLLKSI